jgi:Trk K+ transport system NAD-binding subunit
MNLRELAGDAKVIDVTVADTAESAGLSIRELSDEGFLEDGLLIVAIERDDEVIMPNGETVIQSGDIVTVLSQHGDAEGLTELFSGSGLRDDVQSAEESQI